MSAPTSKNESSGRQRPLLILAASIVGVLVVTVTAFIASSRIMGDDDIKLDWSGFPRTVGCASVPYGSESREIPSFVQAPAPDPVLARTVHMQQLSDQRLGITIDFVGTPPPAPRKVLIPGYGDQSFSEPGSSDFSVVVFPGGVAVENDDSYDLTIDRTNTERDRWMVYGSSSVTDDAPAESIMSPVVDVKMAGNTIAFTIDLAQFPPVAEGWIQPVDVSVYPKTAGYPNPGVAGGGLIQYQRQDCTDRTPTTDDSPKPNSSATNTIPTIDRSSESAERESGDLFAGTPVSPGACADGGICELSAPSGDYYCTITRTGAFCSSPLGEPLTSGIEDRLITVSSNGETGFLADSGGNSHLEDRQSMQENTFPYGSTLTAYGMTCTFGGATGGANCRHDASGHGFTIDTTQYRFF